jgi:hypothetical protein
LRCSFTRKALLVTKKRSGLAGTGPPCSVKRATILLVAASLLIACGGGGAPGLTAAPSRSAGARPTVTATLPDFSRTPTLPERATDGVEPPGTTGSVARPAHPTEIPRTTEQPAPSAAGPALTTAAQATTPSPTAAGASAPADTTSWLWWLLGAIVVVVAVVVPLLLRARRRRAWQDDLAMAESEIAWLARSFIPELRRVASPDQAVGAWTIEANRVSALEDRLSGLEATAPDDAGRIRALTLRDAVRSAGRQLNVLVRAGQFDTLAWDLDAVAAELETALAEGQGHR